jgi:hypothetical protein
MAKKKSLNAQSIVDQYADYVLTENERPKSVYQFAKSNGFTEKEFYDFFGSFEAIEEHFLDHLLAHSIGLMEKDKAYKDFDQRNKLLTLYFTLFEMLKVNRSFVMFCLNKERGLMENIKVLKPFKQRFTDFIEQLDIELTNIDIEALNKFKNASVKEAAWAQLMITLKFWMDDRSSGFEKTDIFIEKSINTGFQIIDTSPLSSLIDLGKFIYQEKVKPQM